ncbi:hypothetical protein [Fibrella forsythiae]|uniref:YD repeat-containing protein n=1 Tax=Fibrella forsythiae TaxID=2817061 RepID=A0ABS3JC39_9BACT|nr:hypothetical protein [Fibrella forsythiae]MBO0947023.1 hypothetical protein [Fibrella forsythiae]
MKEKRRVFYVLAVCWLFFGCDQHPDMAMLDKGIPQIETPFDQIALVRSTLIDKQLMQTTLLDREGRTLEVYNFGRTNSKLLNQYDGPFKVRSVTYFHNDDNRTGTNDVAVHHYSYDRQGRLYQEIVAGTQREQTILYSFAADGDTIKSVLPDVDAAVRTDTDQWIRNEKGQLVRYLRLYVSSSQNGKSDTIIRLSRRYAYSPDGRLARTWYDGKYPETVRYQYDRLGRLISEQHEHTINQTTRNEFTYRKAGTIRYTYEAFDPKRQLPLYVPPLD